MRIELNKIKQWLIKNRVELIFFVIYLAIALIAILFHENWEDEAQAWLTARDCSPIELIGRMKYEGHFLPWYFIIMPFAKLGFPFRTINFISWAICGISAWLMLKHLPCKKYKRILLIFTLPMLYLYPVVARCYCLIPLATILLIMFYRKRLERPIPYLLSIILMANIHIYCFIFAFILGLEFTVDWFKVRKKLKREQNRKLIIYIISTAIVTMLTYIPLFGNSAGIVSFDGTQLDLIHLLLGDPVVTMAVSSSIVPEVITYVLVVVIISYFILYRFNTFLKLSLSILWQFFVFDCFFTMLLPQRAFIPVFFLVIFIARGELHRHTEINLLSKIVITVILIALVIISGSLFCEILAFVFCLFAYLPLLSRRIPKMLVIRKTLTTTLVLLAAISIAESVVYIKNDISQPYSESYDTANYIKENLLVENSQALFVTDTDDTIAISAVIAHLDRPSFKIYDINYGRFVTYDPLFRRQTAPLSAADLEGLCSGLKANCYYIANYDVSREALREIASNDKTSSEHLVDAGIIELLYDSHNDGNTWEAPTEHYRIYKANF